MEKSGNSLERQAQLATLNQHLRWLSAYSVLSSHLLARRLGINSTDLEAYDILTLSGPIPAGRLAALTGLTSGAATSLIDRLEDIGLARREPDPTDRRRVIVRALPPPEAFQAMAMPAYSQMDERMDALLESFDDAELTLIEAFLQRTVAISADQIAALSDNAPPATIATAAKRA